MEHECNYQSCNKASDIKTDQSHSNLRRLGSHFQGKSLALLEFLRKLDL